jgi:hypothetical protein
MRKKYMGRKFLKSWESETNMSYKIIYLKTLFNLGHMFKEDFKSKVNYKFF